jgi:tetratricopeptide (TPR) repeat protein
MRLIAATLVGVLALSGCAAANSAKGRSDVVELRHGHSPDQLLERGRAFAAIGDLTRAEQYLSAALDAGGDSTRILPLLLEVCVQSGRYRVADEYVAQYLRRDPENVRLHLLRGLLEAAIGDRTIALKEFQIVLRVEPDDSEGHYALAVLLRDEMEDRVGADAHFQAYLRVAPTGAHAAEARAFLEEGP